MEHWAGLSEVVRRGALGGEGHVSAVTVECSREENEETMSVRPSRVVLGLVFGLVGCTQGPMVTTGDRSQQGAKYDKARAGFSIQAANPNPGILPPQSHPHGYTYGEWGAKWWQWVLSIPSQDNPLLDTTGASASVGQSGSVWYLAGVFSESGAATRSVTIPSGKALFFPVLNVVASELTNDGPDETQYRPIANQIVDTATNLSAEIDGKSVSDLQRYRADSPIFTYNLPADNVLGVPGGGSSKAVTDGYWLFLSPLSVGEHTIHFHGTFPDAPFTLDIQYFLTVKPEGE